MPTPRPIPTWDSEGRVHYPPPPKPSIQSDRARTADQRRWIAMGDLFTNQYSALPCTPDLPGGYFRKPPSAVAIEDDNDKTGATKVASTKTADTSIFTGSFFSALPDYLIEEGLSVKSLTGNEILQVAHRENFYTSGAVLNSNILDIVDSKNFYSPTEIIKLQRPDLSYFQNNLSAYTVSLRSSIIAINVPSAGIDQSYKVQVETFAPKSIKNDTIY